LDRLGDSIPYQARPIGIANGVDENWKPPAQIKPGDFLTLPPGSVDAAGNGPMPTLSYLAPEIQYIAADWQDLNFFLDHSLEMHGIPPSLIRMAQQSAASGIAIQSEQLPLLQWVESRRGQWAWYEERAALMCLLVASSHLTANGAHSDAGRLAGALREWEFSLRWPALYVQLPGPDRDRADEWRIQQGLANRVTILCERQDLTEQEAFDYLAKLEEQNQKLEALGVGPAPASQQSQGFGGFGQGPGLAANDEEGSGAGDSGTPEPGSLAGLDLGTPAGQADAA
jgi:hypothetical protein